MARKRKQWAAMVRVVHCDTAQKIRAVARRREERLGQDEEKFHITVRKEGERLVPLRDGTEADIGEVQGVMAASRLLREREPQAFQALLALVQGNPENVHGPNINVLKKWHSFLAEDGSVEPIVRRLLLLAGPDLKDPYRADSAKDRFMSAVAEEEHRETLEEARPLLDAILGRGKGRKPGKGAKRDR